MRWILYGNVVYQRQQIRNQVTQVQALSLATYHIPDSNCFSTYLPGCYEDKISSLLPHEPESSVWYLRGMQVSLSEWPREDPMSGLGDQAFSHHTPAAS